MLTGLSNRFTINTEENGTVINFFPDCKETLPKEIINLIFLQLSASDLSQLKTVCWSWKKGLLNNPAIVAKLKFALECLNAGVDLSKDFSKINNPRTYYIFNLNRSNLLGIYQVIRSMEVFLKTEPSEFSPYIGPYVLNKTVYLKSFIEHWVEKDQKLTKDAILALPKGKFKNTLIPHFIMCAPKLILEDAMELIESISSKPLRAGFLRVIVPRIINMFPCIFNQHEILLQTVLRLIQKFPSEIDKSTFLAQLVKKQLPIDRSEAKKIAEQILDPNIKFNIDLEIVKSDALYDLKGTKNKIQALKKSRFKNQSLRIIVEIEAQIDLCAAKETIKFITSDEVRDRALLAIVIAEAAVNISEAKKTVELFSNAKGYDLTMYKSLALLNIAKIEARQDPMGAKKTAELIMHTSIMSLAYLLMADPYDKFALDQYEKILQSI